MRQIAVVYWTSTGNTEEMAKAIADGVKEAGIHAVLLQPSEFSTAALNEYNAVAFGCPAMGDEVLEETEFEPMFSEIENALDGKTIALFGSYGWGDGQWMKDWCERCKKVGAVLLDSEGLIVMESPDDEALALCKKLGAALATC